ncbi:DUF3500 domain-containing protein [Nocardioides sp. GY 10127]|uniref:DUF3500 domain-containing protein n=1 Tax=Nocardioides sp. GY 10127 TaxID=2569762 RepID=UPI0010A7D0B2|nr:DUF3500 domain-containing protein [Nocardioides sp. GY 10127]TIC79297.1 DUF3500 domain-containing protein [Nocardioides sp. GY 10127]
MTATDTRPETTAPATSGGLTYQAPQTIRQMLFATWALLDSLDPALRAQAISPDMEDPRRVDWDFIPKPDRAGVPLSKLVGHQRTLAQTLIKTGLSMRGYSQVLSVMATENLLREMEVVERRFGVLAGDFRDPDGYWLSFFGRPAFEDTWGWRIAGHHLSLSFTVVAQRFLTITPFAMGAMPIPAGVLDPLGLNGRMAFDLLGSLSEDARAAAHVHDVAPADFVTRQVPRVGAEEWSDNVDLGIPGYIISDEDRRKLAFVQAAPSGLRGSDMTGDQLTAARELLLRYVETGPDELTAQYRRDVLAGDPSKLVFAWAGGLAPDTAHYYRVSTEHLLLEADNAVAAGQHVHTVWRDLANDLGGDLLVDHYARHDHGGAHLQRRLVSNRPTEDSPLVTDSWYAPEPYAVKPNPVTLARGQ